MSIYQERLDRIKAAVALEPVDRLPFVMGGNAVNAAITGTSIGEYCADMKVNCDTNLKGYQLIGDVDAVQSMIFEPYLLSTCWLSEVKVPGQELPDDELWQIHEKELMTQEDYDIILEGGFGPWYQKFLVKKFDDPLAKSQDYFEYLPTAARRFYEAGIPCINGASFFSPFEMICGGRSMLTFFTEDLMGIPDKLEKVFDVVQAFNLQLFESQLKNPETRPLGAWVGGWRGVPGMISQEMFERFSWKYMKELIDLLLSYDVIPVLHLDSNWDMGLAYFKEVAPKKCIMSLDGKTDIFKAKEILGDRMCLMGDVPAELLTFSSPEDVGAYCQKRVRELGPTGYIVSSGCDTPYDAKLENIQAMAASVHL